MYSYVYVLVNFNVFAPFALSLMINADLSFRAALNLCLVNYACAQIHTHAYT